MPRTLIEHVDVITLDGQDRLLKDVSIAIDGPSIVAVGEVPPDFQADEIIDGAHHVALPGLFNAHCHSPMTLERGWAEDLPFDRWLNERIWVAESALEEEDVYWGAALAACEMLRAGVVAFADHYFYMDQVARVVQESGMKALLAWCIFGHGPDKEVGGVSLQTTTAFARSWRGEAQGRIRTAMGPHSPYMCPPELLRHCSEAARTEDVGLHLHLAESTQQVEKSLQQYGLRPVPHVAAQGCFDVPRCIAAHCIAVDDQADIDLLREHGVHVAYTPKTYMKLAMGMTPLQRLMDNGVALALGTDGPASNSDLNLLEVLRLTGLLAKWQQQDAEAVPVLDLLRLGSLGGARAMGFEHSGVIAPGMRADLMLVDTRAPHFCPDHNIPAAVVYASHPADVSHVMVNGRLLLRQGELLTLDEEKIRDEARRRALRMVGGDMSRVRAYKS